MPPWARAISWRQDGEGDRRVQRIDRAGIRRHGPYAFLGLSYRHLGRFDEAKKYFEEGLKLDRHNISCLFNLGFIEERQGDHAGAEALFQQVTGAQSGFPEALLELANLRTANKKSEQAAELLRRYVKVSPIPPLDITS